MGFGLKEDKKYTWQDYLAWPDSERHQGQKGIRVRLCYFAILK